MSNRTQLFCSIWALLWAHFSLVEEAFKRSMNMSGWWFQSLEFSPLFGEDFQFDEHIFQMGWFNHQPDVFC